MPLLSMEIKQQDQDILKQGVYEVRKIAVR